MNISTPLREPSLETLRTTLATNSHPPVVYYILSSALPAQNGQIVRIANEGDAPMPYDLICHPDQLPVLQQALAGVAELRPHTNRHWQQRIEQMVDWWGQTSSATHN